jgi:signal transduction histidine kinase
LSKKTYGSFLTFFALGSVIGLKLPDLDFELTRLLTSRLVLHRSILTHGFWGAVLLFVLARQKCRSLWRALMIGFSLALAVHICFDLFPRRWIGYALIHVPLIGRTSLLFSWLWIAGTMLICLYLAFRVVQSAFEAYLALGGIVTIFGLYAPAESVFIGPGLILAAAVGLALMLPSDLNRSIKKWRASRHDSSVKRIEK